MTESKSISSKILELTGKRPNGTICPSEVARALYDDWRPRMEEVRQVAYQLRDEGKIEVTQKGKVVEGVAKGAIRLGSN